MVEEAEAAEMEEGVPQRRTVRQGVVEVEVVVVVVVEEEEKERRKRRKVVVVVVVVVKEVK